MNQTTLFPVDPNICNTADADPERRERMGRMRAATLSLDKARAIRDLRMQQVLNHAEDIRDQWGRVAYLFLVRYAQSTERFIAHDVVTASKLEIDQPHDDKAWGPIFKRALSVGCIERRGYAQAPHRHASPVPEYRSLIVRVAA